MKFKLYLQLQKSASFLLFYSGPGLRAFGVCFSVRDMKEVAFGAMVDGEGEVCDFIKLKVFCKCNR